MIIQLLYLEALRLAHLCCCLRSASVPMWTSLPLVVLVALRIASSRAETPSFCRKEDSPGCSGLKYKFIGEEGSANSLAFNISSFSSDEAHSVGAASVNVGDFNGDGSMDMVLAGFFWKGKNGSKCYTCEPASLYRLFLRLNDDNATELSGELVPQWREVTGTPADPLRHLAPAILLIDPADHHFYTNPFTRDPQSGDLILSRSDWIIIARNEGSLASPKYATRNVTACEAMRAIFGVELTKTSSVEYKKACYPSVEIVWQHKHTTSSWTAILSPAVWPRRVSTFAMTNGSNMLTNGHAYGYDIVVGTQDGSVVVLEHSSSLLKYWGWKPLVTEVRAFLPSYTYVVYVVYPSHALSCHLLTPPLSRLMAIHFTS